MEQEHLWLPICSLICGFSHLFFGILECFRISGLGWAKWVWVNVFMEDNWLLISGMLVNIEGCSRPLSSLPSQCGRGKLVKAVTSVWGPYVTSLEEAGISGGMTFLFQPSRTTVTTRKCMGRKFLYIKICLSGTFTKVKLWNVILLWCLCFTCLYLPPF